ncbi:acetyl-CoA synthetase-like protein [Hesseltinella vesiculosa]|uniref:Acetyl-CoA synthetase-like protein n=1 Tax=Hesseltinella vesiculosa TaxID=101127 RepID=A0A1X2GC14_9FUNG|nr:acetyl-CoA synthetase-like protein [Hesseltinella vesiculosa]
MVIYKSTCHPVTIPNLDIFSFIFGDNEFNAKLPHDRKVLIDAFSDRSLTFEQVRTQSRRLAKGWQDTVGLEKNEVVAVFAPNQYDHAVLYFSLLAAGLTVSPGNPNYTVEECHHLLHTAGASAIVTVPELLPLISVAATRNNINQDRVFVFGDTPCHGYQSLGQVRSNREIPFPNRQIDPHNDLAFIMFSSGTSGQAKGCMLTHRNFVSQLLCVMTFEREDGVMGEDDRMLAFLPFFHIFGLTTLLLRAMYGLIPVVIMPKFELQKYLELVEKHKITIATLVPPIAVLLSKSPLVPKYDLSSIRLITSGAAPLSKEHIDEIHKRIPVPVRQGYGLTETNSGFIYQSVNGGDVGATGRLVSHGEVKIVDEFDNELGDDQRGELLMRGPFQMKGYIRNPVANQTTFTPDGWMRTGDVAVYNSKTQEFYIVDRIKELIKTNGNQVPPAELEALLLSHPAVADCCVVGVYNHAKATEYPRGYVVLQVGYEPTKALALELQTYVQSRVISYKRLGAGVHFVDTIPKSNSGKILRRLVKEWVKKDQTMETQKARL